MSDVGEDDPDAAAAAEDLAPTEDETLDPRLIWIWRAFWAVDRDRPFVTVIRGEPMGAIIGMPVPCRIPFVAINTYADRFGIAGEDFELLLHCIAEMDEEYRAVEQEKLQALH